jgi:hypothetical protein
MSSFIPYQVDYSVQNAAKTLGFSKKRVTFKFGFANKAAIQAGEAGPQCRGSEHEIIFIWSLASGKRQILCDNKDVHFSASGQNGWTNDREWQHVFTLRDSSNQSYRVHFLSQSAVKDMPNVHPFDIKIGGLSYFQFNPIYQLGTPRMVIGQAPSHHHSSGRDSPMTAEERQQLAAAKLASLQDIAEQKEREAARRPAVPAPPAPPPDAPLISFDDDAPTPAAPVPATVVPPSSTMFSASSISLDPMLNDSSLEFNRQQPGSFYGSNPYAMSNSVGGTTASGYSMPTNPYAPSSTSYGASPTSASTALTPYQPPGATAAPQQPYVDATGRLNMSGGSYGTNPYEYASASNSNIPPLASPSAMSYGSAPSFAQPPKPPPANPYGSTQPSYGEAPYANPYGAPAAEAPSPYANPYGTTATTQPAPYGNPYAPEASANPYGAAATTDHASHPYGAPAAYGANPYGAGGSATYGAPPTPATYNPY